MTLATDIQSLDLQLVRKKAELVSLTQECRQIRQERDRLLRAIEGQLDLFRQEITASARRLGEVRHG
ncbi:MAG: hypothetical protein CMN25_00735 [Salinicola sp.]|uniref:hypothetical protein n=1 Tax=uncultured Salinicola sp. TaxID=1193542 RepID=UPI000C8D5339|nr:hypothetical protein [uncultured Salinicola sp.]MAM55849.1 hypothetical protein [Salinicola sp.]|tara:strand:+ start:524 stop:724 length:201 start_codon:yes stop_codon:yes gene_type:complete